MTAAQGSPAPTAEDGLDAIRLRNLQRLFNPRSVAVVGASSDPAKAGSQALKTLSRFPGTLVAVHPRETEIDGTPCYPSLRDVPEPVDLAVLAIPAKFCAGALRDAAESGVGGVFIVSGGFAETGAEGAAREAELGRICAETGLRLLGPNTSGFVNPAQGCIASFVPGVDRIRAGSVAVIAQSGGVNLSLGYLLEGLGAGVSIAAGLGNAVDVTTSDMLDLLARDPGTAAIALHMEGVTDGRRLFDALCRVTPLKPVVALVAGRADIGAFAVSHTGKLMGSRARTVAALEQGGAVVVETLDQLAEAAHVLSRRRMAAHHAPGLGLVTGQAGPGLLIADEVKSRGIAMPELAAATQERIAALLPPMTFLGNPVDTGRPGPGFPEIVGAVAADDGIDAVLVFGISEPAVLDPVAALLPAHEATGKPVLFGTLGPDEDVARMRADLAASDTPVLLGPDRLAQAAAALAGDARAQWRLAHQPPTITRATAPLAGALDEDASKALLREHGIAAPRGILCESRAAAEAAFAGLTKPVVVKIAGADIAHKTEAGGVILNVHNEADLAAALDRIAAIPTSTPERVLIEEMAPEGVELIVGAVRDPSWGPCVVVGLGGVQAEALADTQVALAPLSGLQAEEMLGRLRGAALLDGFRGMPAADRAAIGAVAVALGQILLDHPEIREIEINPLRCNGDRLLALDALVVLGG